MTVVSEMLGVPTPGFKWVYPPRTRCWRLLCRGASDGFFLALLLGCSSVLEEIHQRLLESVHCLDCFLGLLGLLRPWPAVLGVREFARVSPLASALPILTAGLTAVPGVALSFAFAPAPTAAPAAALAALASTVPAVALLGFFGRPRHQPVAALAGWAGYHAVPRQVQRLLRR